LADEQDSYQFLNETLVGQQQNLQRKSDFESTLHDGAATRSYSGNGQEDNKIDLKPILIQLKSSYNNKRRNCKGWNKRFRR